MAWNLKQQQQRQEQVEVEEARRIDPLTCKTIRERERDCSNLFLLPMYGFFLLFLCLFFFFMFNNGSWLLPFIEHPLIWLIFWVSSLFSFQQNIHLLFHKRQAYVIHWEIIIFCPQIHYLIIINSGVTLISTCVGFGLLFSFWNKTISFLTSTFSSFHFLWCKQWLLSFCSCWLYIN